MRCRDGCPARPPPNAFRLPAPAPHSLLILCVCHARAPLRSSSRVTGGLSLSTFSRCSMVGSSSTLKPPPSLESSAVAAALEVLQSRRPSRVPHQRSRPIVGLSSGPLKGQEADGVSQPRPRAQYTQYALSLRRSRMPRPPRSAAHVCPLVHKHSCAVLGVQNLRCELVVIYV